MNFPFLQKQSQGKILIFGLTGTNIFLKLVPNSIKKDEKDGINFFMNLFYTIFSKTGESKDVLEATEQIETAYYLIHSGGKKLGINQIANVFVHLSEKTWFFFFFPKMIPGEKIGFEKIEKIILFAN